MAGDLIITASAIITMDKAAPRATAVAVDTDSGTITAVGSLAQCGPRRRARSNATWATPC